MPDETMPDACERCGQTTRHFWLAEGGALLPWCNFCVTAQVLAYFGATRAHGLITVFTRAIDSGAPSDVRSVSVALRALAVLIHGEIDK